MARGLNQVSLIGNLGADPEVRALASGITVCNLRVAVSEQWKDKATGENKESTEWVTCVIFDKLGEVAAEYLKKGSKVFLQGKLKTRKWQDKEGNDRYSTEVRVSEMLMLDGRPGGTQDSEESPPARRQRPRSAAPADHPVDLEFNDEVPM